jgi:4a-hydroxytetrahydrobiopterin dehydratase
LDTDLYTALPENQVQSLLETLPHWKRDGKAIVRVQTFRQYRDAIEFVYRVGLAAEELDHHPDIMMNFKRIEIRYWTHKARGLTRLDFESAKVVDQLALRLA